MTSSRVYEIFGEIIKIDVMLNIPEVVSLGMAPDDVMDEAFGHALELFARSEDEDIN